MLRRSGVVFGTVLAIAVAGIGVKDASAVEPPRERARMVILDTCVMASATKGNSFTDFSKICNCAAKKSLEELNDSSIESIASSGELGWGNASIWRKHVDACSTQ